MRPYTPDRLPLHDIDYKRLFAVSAQANANLARYDGLLAGVGNPHVMLSPLTTQEAVLSSRIEGTRVTVDEVLQHDAGMKKTAAQNADIIEVKNYRIALSAGMARLAGKPITLAFIKELHKILMDGTRAADTAPGEFRCVQNWIGKPGCTMKTASFVPPAPATMNSALAALETYMHGNDIDALLQTAVSHAQFELIHPFRDGNGRIGRILIPLLLYQKQKLAQPMFYLSSFLESNRDEYYYHLNSISHSGYWNGWIEYFLGALSAQAQTNIRKVTQIMALHQHTRQQIQTITKSQYATAATDAIFNTPIFNTKTFITATNANKMTALRILAKLQANGIIREIEPAVSNKPAVMAFSAILEITEKP